MFDNVSSLFSMTGFSSCFPRSRLTCHDLHFGLWVGSTVSVVHADDRPSPLLVAQARLDHDIVIDRAISICQPTRSHTRRPSSLSSASYILTVVT